MGDAQTRHQLAHILRGAWSRRGFLQVFAFAEITLASRPALSSGCREFAETQHQERPGILAGCSRHIRKVLLSSAPSVLVEGCCGQGGQRSPQARQDGSRGQGRPAELFGTRSAITAASAAATGLITAAHVSSSACLPSKKSNLQPTGRAEPW